MFDGQMDDTRMCLDALLTSTIDGYVEGMKGSNILNYCKFEEFIKDEETGMILGGVVTDKLSKEKIKVNAKVVVNATGVFSDTLRKMDDPSARPRVVPSAGTHITMPKHLTQSEVGMLTRTSDGRVLFMLPWLGKTVVGTTDEPSDHIVQHVTATDKEVKFIIENLSEYMDSLDALKPEELCQSKWSGLRPLV